jgi:hypothetical protein
MVLIRSNEVVQDMRVRFDRWVVEKNTDPEIITLSPQSGDESKITSWQLTKLEEYFKDNGRFPVEITGSSITYKPDEEIKPPTEIPPTSCNGEIWSYAGVDGEYEPSHQTTDYNCSVASFCQIVYRMLNRDLSESSLTDRMVDEGYLSTTDGAGHNIFYRLRDLYAPELDITEYNLSDTNWCKLAKLNSSNDTQNIYHILYEGLYGHYLTSGAFNFNEDTVRVLTQLNAGKPWLWVGTLNYWINLINSPSIIQFRRK